MSQPPISLAVIVGSTRVNRVGGTVADWFLSVLRARGDVAPDVIDLAVTDLPPRIPDEPDPRVDALERRLAQADAVVVVTPEYNHSFPGPLKHAIDLTSAAWQATPVAFVSYGGISGGLRAVEQLRLVLAELHAVTVRDTVSFHGAGACFDGAGRPRDEEAVGAAATRMVDSLLWWARALRDARAREPYAA